MSFLGQEWGPAFTRACRTCIFVHHANNDRSTCRRHAPTTGTDGRQAHWPEVSADDWCGEWQYNFGFQGG